MTTNQEKYPISDLVRNQRRTLDMNQEHLAKAILLLEEWGTTQWVVRGRCLTGRLLLIVPVVRGRGVSIMAHLSSRDLNDEPRTLTAADHNWVPSTPTQKQTTRCGGCFWSQWFGSLH